MGGMGGQRGEGWARQSGHWGEREVEPPARPYNSLKTQARTMEDISKTLTYGMLLLMAI